MNVAAAAAGRTGRTGFPRLMASLGLASGALSALYAGAGTVLLAQQVENVDRPHKVAVLGVIAGVSAVFAALIISYLGGYRVLFILGGCCGIAGAIAVLPVRAVR